MKKRHIGLAAAGALGAAYLAKKVAAEKKDEKVAEVEEEINSRYYGDKQVYLIGGGIATMAAAAYLIRDANFNGKNIHVIEGMKILGGSNDGIGTNEKGFVARGGRMLNEETYENFWELFASIPSLEWPNHSVTEEILNFDHLHPTHAQARLVTKDQEILDAHTMGFDNEDRLAMTKLLAASEESLDGVTIEEWFGPHFFETNPGTCGKQLLLSKNGAVPLNYAVI